MAIPRLYLKSLRDVRRLGGEALLVVGIIAASVAFTTGLLYTGAHLQATVGAVYAEGALPNYYLSGDFTAEDVDRLSRLGFVEVSAARQELKGVVETRDTVVPGFVYTLEPNPEVDRPIVISGRRDLSPGEALVDTRLADYHGYGVGDEIDVQFAGRPHRLEVVGVVFSPSHVLLAPSQSMPIPLQERVGLVFVHPAEPAGTADDRPAETAGRTDPTATEAAGPGAGGDAVAATYLAVRTRGTADYEDRLEDAFPGAVVTPRGEQFSYDAIQADLDFFVTMTIPFFLMLLAISLIVVYTTTAKLVRAQLVEIGVLRSLGYTGREVVASQALTLLLLSATGAFLGVLGAVAFAWLFAGVYVDVMSLPFLVPADPAPYVVGGFVAGTVLPLAAIAQPMREVLDLTPREAFTGVGRVEPYTGRGGVERLLSAVVRLPVLPRYALRNLSRRPVHTGLTVLGIALAAGAAGTWVFPMDGMGTIVNDQLDAQRWDVSAEATDRLTAADAARLESQPGVREVELYSQTSFELPERRTRTGDSYGLTVVREGTDMVSLPFVAGGMPDTPDGIALSANVARIEGLSLYDRVTIEVAEEERAVTVVGIYRSASKDAYAVTDPDAGGNAAFIRSNDPVGRTDDIIALPEIASAVNVEEVRAGVEALVEGSRAYLYVGALVGAVVAVLFTFSNVTLEVLRRADEYNVMRALGYFRREVVVGILVEVLVQGVVAAVPGVLLGFGGGWLLFRYATEANEIFGYAMPVQPTKFAIVFGLIVGGVLLVVYPAYRQLSEMDVAELGRKGTG